MSAPMSCDAFRDFFDPDKVSDETVVQRRAAWFLHEKSCPECSDFLAATMWYGFGREDIVLVTENGKFRWLQGVRRRTFEHTLWLAMSPSWDAQNREGLDEQERHYFLACYLRDAQEAGKKEWDPEEAFQRILRAEQGEE